MYEICACPFCKKPIVEKISITGLEKRTFESEKEALNYVLENVTIKTVPLDPEFATDLLNVLKSSIPDEHLYEIIMKRVQDVFEAHF